MTNSFYGAILVLNCTPDIETLDAIAHDVATEHLLTDTYNFRLSSKLPPGTPVDVADQHTAKMRDLPNGTYLIVTPGKVESE